MNMPVPAWVGKVEELDATEFNRLARSTTDPLLLYIGAPWCPPCKTMGPAFDAAAAAMVRRPPEIE
ncbi:thioredoxin family protein [Stenotrophomonas rhizophila]|uniref:thioredoxin family protein n=2 Tax=Stenotrophomonas rhizophila TaxID=216778 RepID=UPI0031CA4B24|nr:thioredoxin family protein [Stenotrophomonas rhizophila]MCC7665474.1 thioredoxin family protein [Stenotrophomonas rhizophila]